MPPLETIYFLSLMLAVVTIGLVAGLFFIFSNTVMQSLADTPLAQGMVTMQIINRKILNPLFLIIFAGSAVACLPVLIIGALWSQTTPFLAILGTLTYLIGGFGITVLCNVPLNNALENSDAASQKGIALWQHYQTRWTQWNHLRTGASIIAISLLIASCIWS